MEINFNTSHVVVYQIIEIFTDPGDVDFNTSHVVVYRAIPFTLPPLFDISIHLML